MNGRVDIDLAVLAKNWWIVALRGVAAILFGILTAIVPGLSLAALVMLFGAYALIEGKLDYGDRVFLRGSPLRGQAKQAEPEGNVEGTEDTVGGGC